MMEGIKEIIELNNEVCNTNNDADFCSFYYKAVKRLLDIDNISNVSYLYRYTKIFSKYYNIYCNVKSDIEDPSDDIIQLLKDSLYYRLIYIYRNATLLSSAVAFHFRNICKNDPHIIKRLIKKKLLKICTFGGSSIPGIVAIITVLKSIALKIGIELDFRVTIIDFDPDWKNSCVVVLSCLKEFHEATWKINFIECKRKIRTWKAEVIPAIQEADIVTIVTLTSDVGYKQNIVKVICEELQKQAIFFVIDCPATNLIKFYNGVSDLYDLHLIHMELYDYHTLDIETVKLFRTLYKKYFGIEKYLRSNLACYLFASVWMRASLETEIRHQSNLECMFQTHDEKYNPKPSFLSHNALTKWENLFTQKKEAAGWKAKGIKQAVLKEKGKRNNMFGKYIPEKKGVHSLQNHLLTQVDWLENDRKAFSETNKKSLDEYLIQKRKYSLTKKNAYFASLTALNTLFVIE